MGADRDGPDPAIDPADHQGRAPQCQGDSERPRNKDYLQNNLDSAMNNYTFFHNTPP